MEIENAMTNCTPQSKRSHTGHCNCSFDWSHSHVRSFVVRLFHRSVDPLCQFVNKRNGFVFKRCSTRFYERSETRDWAVKKRSGNAARLVIEHQPFKTADKLVACLSVGNDCALWLLFLLVLLVPLLLLNISRGCCCCCYYWVLWKFVCAKKKADTVNNAAVALPLLRLLLIKNRTKPIVCVATLAPHWIVYKIWFPLRSELKSITHNMIDNWQPTPRFLEWVL